MWGSIALLPAGLGRGLGGRVRFAQAPLVFPSSDVHMHCVLTVGGRLAAGELQGLHDRVELKMATPSAAGPLTIIMAELSFVGRDVCAPK